MICVIGLLFTAALLLSGAEVVFEKDWPRSFGKYAILFGALLLLSIPAFGQAAYYGSNITTAGLNVPPGAQAPVFTVPYARITVCAYPVVLSTGGVCTNTVPVYSDQALSVLQTQPIVSDARGQFGFWATSGTYAYSVQSPGGNSLGTYTLTIGGSGGGAVAPRFWRSVNTFGDSICQGAGSAIDTAPTDYTTGTQIGNTGRGYCALLASDFGPGSMNYAKGGDASEDLSLKVYPNPAKTIGINPRVANNPLNTIMIGTNDAQQCGANAACQDTYTRSLQFADAWAAIPDVAKIQTGTPSCTQDGTWASNPNFANALYSITQGSKLTCTVTTYGKALYIGYVGLYGQAGTSSVSIDGTAVAPIAYTSNLSTVNSAGSGLALMLQRYPLAGASLGTVGTHTVVFNVTSSTTAFNTVSPLWLGGYYPEATTTVGPPAVYQGGVPWEQNDTNSSVTAAYNTLSKNAAATLTADGLDVTWVDVRAVMNSTTDFNGGYVGANGVYCYPTDPSLLPLHPDNCGHAHIAQAFEQTIGIVAVRNNTNGPTLGYANPPIGFADRTRPGIFLNSDTRDGYRNGVSLGYGATQLEAGPNNVVHMVENGLFGLPENSVTTNNAAGMPRSSDGVGGGVLLLTNTNGNGHPSGVDFGDPAVLQTNGQHIVRASTGYDPTGSGSGYSSVNGNRQWIMYANGVRAAAFDQTGFHSILYQESWPLTPPSASATCPGGVGSFESDLSFMYWCTTTDGGATTQWKSVPLSAFQTTPSSGGGAQVTGVRYGNGTSPDTAATPAQIQAASTDTSKNAALKWSYASGGDIGCVVDATVPVQWCVTGGAIQYSIAGGAFANLATQIIAGSNITISQSGNAVTINSTATGTGNTTSSTLTTNTVPKATSANAIGNSLLTDDGTTLTYGGTGGVKTTGTAPRFYTNQAGNTDLAGQLTLSGGTASFTFLGTYATAPICVATDTTAASAVRVQTTTTALTITGTGTDVVNYICMGRT